MNLQVLAATIAAILLGQSTPGSQSYQGAMPSAEAPGTQPTGFRIFLIGNQAFTSPPRVNNRRQVVGTSQYLSGALGSPEAFSWRSGQGMGALGTLGGSFSFAAAVNERGDVVGESRTGGGKPANRAFLWRRGRMRNLGTLGGSWSAATAVNNSGRVVGESAGQDGRSRPFIWKAGRGMEDLNPVLGLSANDLTRVSAISENGWIAGETSAFLGFHAFAWDREGGLRDLGTLGGVSSAAFDVNNAGQVVGSANTAAQASHAFLWDPAQGMQDLGTLGGAQSEAFAVNESGQVVGTSQDSNGQPRAFIWQSGIMLDLNTLLPPGSGWVLTEATDINNGSWIVGRGTLHGQSEAFLLCPP